MVRAVWHALPGLCFAIAHPLFQSFCDLSPVYLSSMMFLPLYSTHTPHIPFIQTPKGFPSPTISSVWSVCPEAGSDHPAWNAFKDWDRWHSLMYMNEYVFSTTKLGIFRKRKGHTRRVRWGWLWALLWLWCGVKARSSLHLHCGLKLHSLKFQPAPLCMLIFLVGPHR